MEKVYISESGPEVSAAIYSFWRYNTPALNSIKKIEDIVNYNLELGVNTFDHSDQYGQGKTEDLFGQALKNRSFKREDIIISTKAGIITSGKHQIFDLSPEHLIKSVYR